MRKMPSDKLAAANRVIALTRLHMPLVELHDLAKAAGLGLWAGEKGRITIHDGILPYPREIASLVVCATA